MISFLKGDVLNADADIICHQTNCKGVMGSGVAKAVKAKYPEAYQSYHDAYNAGKLKLGYVDFAKTHDDKIIANLCGQNNYGYDGNQYTDYNALRTGFETIKTYMLENNLKTIALPYKMACCRGGGDWSVVYNMIEEIFAGLHVQIISLAI